MNNVCLSKICDENTLCKAHLIPKSFVREIYFFPKNDEKHIIHDTVRDKKLQSNTGQINKSILCSKCDGILGQYEENAFNLLKRLRLVKIGKKKKENFAFVKEGTYKFQVAIVDDFIRFACGILWKYASISPENQSYINIEEHRELLRQICFEKVSIPESIDVFIERDLLSYTAFKDINEVYYYRTPSVGMRGYKKSHKFAWFTLCNFIIYIKLEGNEISDYAPEKCWMRGKKEVFFNVDLRSLEVNRDVFKSIDAVRGDLARLNKKFLF